MTTTSTLIRDARRQAGLTQAQLAAHMGTTQSAVARLEAPGSNPRVRTVEEALRAAGRRLELAADEPARTVDESLIQANLALTPRERLERFERAYARARRIALAGARARGELA